MSKYPHDVNNMTYLVAKRLDDDLDNYFAKADEPG